MNVIQELKVLQLLFMVNFYIQISPKDISYMTHEKVEFHLIYIPSSNIYNASWQMMIRHDETAAIKYFSGTKCVRIQRVFRFSYRTETFTAILITI